MCKLYPLRLEPQIKEVVWGGRWLVDELGRPGPVGARLGESWEAYSNSIVANGALVGHKLGDLFYQYGPVLVGQVAMPYPKFPLLVKFIDAHENLSVQVHPDDKLAQQLENYPFGKTEFWYVLAAEPGAEICYGLNSAAHNRAQLAEALRENDLLRYLQRAPVREGDVIFLPAGTVHALTKGIVVYELQQDSDITYRLYDWGRTGREIHIEKGLQAIKFENRNMPVAHPELISAQGYAYAQLIECSYFTATLWQINEPTTLPSAPNSFTLISVLSGAGRLESPDAAFEAEELQRGDTFLLPVDLAFRLIPTQNDAPLKVISSWLV
jgi:mannose-6-phosphate isomerase